MVLAFFVCFLWSLDCVQSTVQFFLHSKGPTGSFFNLLKVGGYNKSHSLVNGSPTPNTQGLGRLVILSGFALFLPGELVSLEVAKP